MHLTKSLLPFLPALATLLSPFAAQPIDSSDEETSPNLPHILTKRAFCLTYSCQGLGDSETCKRINAGCTGCINVGRRHRRWKCSGTWDDTPDPALQEMNSNAVHMRDGQGFAGGTGGWGQENSAVGRKLSGYQYDPEHDCTNC